MSNVLTENSIATCANQGSVQLTAGQSKLTINGSKVLIDGDLNGAGISLCTTVTDPQPGNLQCATITTVVNGVAQKLKVNGKGVLLDDISGDTNGTVGGVLQSWSIQNTEQTKLKTV